MKAALRLLLVTTTWSSLATPLRRYYRPQSP